MLERCAHWCCALFLLAFWAFNDIGKIDKVERVIRADTNNSLVLKTDIKENNGTMLGSKIARTRWI